MRYEHQVVLEMSKPSAAEAPVKAVAEHGPVKTAAKSAIKADPAKGQVHAAVKPAVAKPGAAAKPTVVPAAKPSAVSGAHLQTAFDVHTKSATNHATQVVPQ